MRLPEIQDAKLIQVVVTWDGKKIALRGNVPAEIVVALLEAGKKIALDKWLTSGFKGRSILEDLGGPK
jgi:hypothetical protein